ncbi:MAG: prepilin-type N-terminal cleavage/methylation domain-containing protein [Opitutaceae bacterium]|jgi:prepilin-type N-terminal cleavage/methylation domain-containing protein/prepilin-type processing-associated H-X9-DG protein|nr:prepilin-type N-terminal cleavage/methylation domain-containing protein [Opitutaceae bacterium]
MKTRYACAFTLIELLAVIVIIGILAAIIIPTVGKVRRSAQRAVSASNLRQIGSALTLYAIDNRAYPKWTVQSIHALAGKKGGNVTWTANKRLLNPYLGVQNPDIMPDALPVCHSPADRGDDSRYNTNGSSYGYANLRLDQVPSASGTLKDFCMMIDSSKAGRGLRPTDIKEPSRQIASYEAGAYYLARYGDDPAQVPDSLYWYTERGKNRFNVVFVDGHVAFQEIIPGELESTHYTFRWTK